MSGRVAAQLDAIQAVRRHVMELRRAYARLDAASLGVDDLGPAATPGEVLAGACRELSRLDDALRAACDAVYEALRHTDRLYGQQEN